MLEVSTIHASAADEQYLSLETPDFTLKLTTSSQTATALHPKGNGSFDFTPGDWREQRAGSGFHHLGDLTLRVRKGKAEAWRDYDTASERHPVTALPTNGSVLAAADLSPTLPANSLVQVVRTWSVYKGHLVLRFAIKNKTTQPVDIGALSIPMVFNNIITNRSLEQAHAVCSFADPYVGQDAGYLQVTRLTGKGPALVIVPDGNTPFEAYQILNEPMPPSQTFEGMMSWVVHSQAYAEKEWHNVKPWNPPTMATLAPGQTRTYGVRFLLSPQIRDIEKTLAADDHPVAVGIPGYVLPMDTEGKLFLRYRSKVKALEVEPRGAITTRADAPNKSGLQSYTLQGRIWGRARLTVTYEDGVRQSVHYNVIKPSSEAVADLGNFLMTRQWFDDPNDPFHRSPSAMTYDREANKLVTQDSRVWIAGLQDEGGASAWLAAAMKLFAQPNADEIAKFEQFVDKTLWGAIQYKNGPNKYGVRQSLFFYEPTQVPDFQYDPALNWREWGAWNKIHSEGIIRAYNYPHVVAAYWAMYRIARNHPGLVKNHPWQWYLEQAVKTTQFAFSRDEQGKRRVHYTEVGLMEGTVFLKVLEDLQKEGWAEQKSQVEALMKERADKWNEEAYPFGSEMAWDSTGQEEVYAWCKYFGHQDKAQVTLDTILGYMPTLPHWGYNGNARRYWDFDVAAKVRRIERQLHHYGSGLNAIPALSEYRERPDDFHLLRIGYGGTLGALTNIDREGFASQAFHSFADTLKWDAYSSDYGSNFFGYALNAATYLIDHPDFGWQSFGGNVKIKGDWVEIEPRDALRQRIYLAPSGLWLTLDAGTFENVALNTRTGTVRVVLARSALHTPQARLRIEQPAKIEGVGNYHLPSSITSSNSVYTIPLKTGTTTIELKR